MFRNPSLGSNGTWTTQYWPLHTPIKREVLILDTENDGKSVYGVRTRQCAFWRNLLPQIIALGKLYNNKEII